MKDEILKKVDRLYEMWQNGSLGGEIMPEDENPHLEKSSLENYLYFTLPMALNYQRNSYKLWDSANKTYQDIETRFVFNPQEVLNHSFKEVQEALVKYKVALQKNKQTEIWIKLCQTFVSLFNGDIRKLFDSLDNDVDKIRNFIQNTHKSMFPYLSGTKICNYWLYVIWEYTDREYENIDKLTVAPDTHVIKSTHRLGLINDNELNSANVEQIVIERWNTLFEGTKYRPIDIHTALWLWSRNGFKDLEKHMFDKIVKTSNMVCSKSNFVKVNYNKIDKFLEKNVPNKGKFWLESNIFDLMNFDIRTIVNFLLVYHAIGFSYWSKEKKWSIDTEYYGVVDGSMALMYVLIKNISLFSNFKKLEKIRFNEFKNLLAGNNELSLLEERFNIITNVAHIVCEKMNGDFYEYIKDITDDRELFNLIILNFPNFKDERFYDGETIYFYKLASLLTSDIMHVRIIKEGNNFDYSHIVGCPDYKIPQILRALGLIEYNEKLSVVVDNRFEIEENSKYEVEIRAATITVIDYIRRKTGMCGMDVNDFLWLKSQEPKNIVPYHLTRTTNY